MIESLLLYCLIGGTSVRVSYVLALAPSSSKRWWVEVREAKRAGLFMRASEASELKTIVGFILRVYHVFNYKVTSVYVIDRIFD